MKKKLVLWLAIVAMVSFLWSCRVEALDIEWDANTEADLAGYKVYHGSSSGNYTFVVDVGNQTSYTIVDLPNNQENYIVVTAYDTSGNEGDYSNEITSYRDTIPPAAVGTLRIVN